MPQGDRTGPMGQGPMTGRAVGFCTGYDLPGFTKGFGVGMGRSIGRGFGEGMGRAIGRGFGEGMGRSIGRGFGEGMGRATGRGFGVGRGHGFHGGWGFGRSHNQGLPSSGYSPGAPRSEPFSKENEIKMLKAQAHSIKHSQSDIEKRLKELENEESDT